MSSEQIDCSICLDPLNEGVYRTKCNHHFHRECLSRSLRYDPRKRCPYCRTMIEDKVESNRCIWKSFNECKDFDIEILETGVSLGNCEWIFAKVYNENKTYDRYFYTMYGQKIE